MTLAADQWPSFVAPAADRRSRSGAGVVWRLELAKLRSLLRVRAIAVLCLIVPFLAVVGLNLQTATPGDTQFGQWVHVSGFAIPMVILGFAGQWLLPVLTAVVAGDIFSAEDHFGTWKTILTRSRSRGELFAGKFLAAVTFAVAAMVLLTASDLVAGLLAGAQPVVGLGGQLVPAGHATQLVIASWLSEVPPVLGFTALAVFLSVVSRNSLVGVGGTVLITLVLQIVTLINLPEWGQMALLSTPFLAWHGFWAQPAFYGPFWEGLLTCAGWFAVCGAASWLVFRHRTVGGGGLMACVDPGGNPRTPRPGGFAPRSASASPGGNPRTPRPGGFAPRSASAIRSGRRAGPRGWHVAAGLLLPLLALTVSGCGSTNLTAGRLQASISSTFANLYVLQQVEQGNPRPSARSLDSRASCQRGGMPDVPQDGSGAWLCEITYLVAGPGYPVIAKYKVDVQTDGCYAADGDGPASVNGSPTITGPHYTQLINPLSLIDGCFDTT